MKSLAETSQHFLARGWEENRVSLGKHHKLAGTQRVLISGLSPGSPIQPVQDTDLPLVTGNPKVQVKGMNFAALPAIGEVPKPFQTALL